MPDAEHRHEHVVTDEALQEFRDAQHEGAIGPMFPWPTVSGEPVPAWGDAADAERAAAAGVMVGSREKYHVSALENPIVRVTDTKGVIHVFPGNAKASYGSFCELSVAVGGVEVAIFAPGTWILVETG